MIHIKSFYLYHSLLQNKNIESNKNSKKIKNWIYLVQLIRKKLALILISKIVNGELDQDGRQHQHNHRLEYWQIVVRKWNLNRLSVRKLFLIVVVVGMLLIVK